MEATLAVRIRSARRGFASDAEFASALGTDPETIACWESGQTPGRDHQTLIGALDEVVTRLSTYLSPSSIPKWLNGSNAHLSGGHPITAIRNGRLADVIAAIDAERGGAYA